MKDDKAIFANEGSLEISESHSFSLRRPVKPPLNIGSVSSSSKHNFNGPARKRVTSE